MTMHSLCKLLLALIIAVLAPRAFAEPKPYLNTGRYIGTITVVEKVPLGGFNGLPAGAPAKDYITTRATGRVTASIAGGGAEIRILGTPGMSLLNYLDEPNFAAVKMTFVLEGDNLVPASATARKGAVTVQPKGNRVEIAHENLFYQRQNFANSDEDLLGHLTVRIELTRIGG